jgi:hypothetical protein
VFETRLLWETFECEKEERMDAWKNLHYAVLLIFTIHYRDIIKGGMNFVGAATLIRVARSFYSLLLGNLKE